MNNLLMALYTVRMDTEAIVTVFGIMFLPVLIYCTFHFVAANMEDEKEEPSEFL